MLGRLRRADEIVVERLPDPLIVLAADRSVLRTNAAARAAYGADIGAVLRHPDLRAAVDRALDPAFDPDGGTQPEGAGDAGRACDRPVHGRHDLAGGAGASSCCPTVRANAPIERMRADFVANASHELRTPLASLIGFIDTLRGPAASDPPAQQRFLGIMAEQAARMSRLIDGLLSLSRIELTEHQRPCELVDLSELLPRIAATFEPQTAGRGVTLALDRAGRCRR